MLRILLIVASVLVMAMSWLLGLSTVPEIQAIVAGNTGYIILIGFVLAFVCTNAAVDLDDALRAKRKMLKAIEATYDTMVAFSFPEHPRFGSVDEHELDARLEAMHGILKDNDRLPIDGPGRNLKPVPSEDSD